DEHRRRVGPRDAAGVGGWHDGAGGVSPVGAGQATGETARAAGGAGRAVPTASRLLGDAGAGARGLPRRSDRAREWGGRAVARPFRGGSATTEHDSGDQDAHGGGGHRGDRRGYEPLSE